MDEPATRVIVERGGLGRAGAELERLGVGRALVLTTPARRYLEPLRAALGERCVAVFAEARVHVPREVVDRASGLLEASAIDGLVALGGGSAIGLGKALRLRHDVRFCAVPTTYAGSEMTDIWGVTEAGDKRTGRDPRVRPDSVIYDAELLVGLPRALAVQSLLNALAHPLGALSVEGCDEATRGEALSAVAALFEALRMLIAGDGVEARERALRGAAQAGGIIGRGPMGLQHEVAHLLGGRFGLPHSALHSVLLPQFAASLRADLAPAIVSASRELEPARALFDALIAVGAPTSLAALGIQAAGLSDALAVRAGSSARDRLAWAAFEGGRP